MRLVYKNRYIICSMIFAFFIMSLGLLKTYPLNTSSDELGGLLSAATFAGLDWRGVIEKVGYYGFGWYGLFFWIFKITDDPILIYRTIVLSTIVARTFIIPVAFKIIKEYTTVKDIKLQYLLAFLAPFLSLYTPGQINNEPLLGICVWLIVLLYMEYIRSIGKKNEFKKFVYLLMILFYIFFIHTRALAVVIAVFVLLSLRFLFDKNWKKLLLCIGSLLFLYLISKVIIGGYQDIVWNTTDNKVSNSSVSSILSNNIKLFSIKMWGIWASMFLGHIATANVITAGFFLIAVFEFIILCIEMIKKGCFWKNEMIQIVLVPFLAIIICAAGFFLSNWATDLYGIWNDSKYFNVYAYKAITYIRYWAVWTPPFLMMGIVRFIENYNNKICFFYTLFIFNIYKLFMLEIMPMISKNTSAAYNWYTGGIGRYQHGEKITLDFYKIALLMSILFLLLILFFQKFDKKYLVVVCCIIFFAGTKCNRNLYYDKSVKETMVTKIESSYNLKEKIENENIEIGNISFVDNAKVDNNWKIYYIGQLYFNRYKCDIGIPQEMKENDVIITNMKNVEIEDKFPSIHYYTLDENEVWYTYIDLQKYI